MTCNGWASIGDNLPLLHGCQGGLWLCQAVAVNHGAGWSPNVVRGDTMVSWQVFLPLSLSKSPRSAGWHACMALTQQLVPSAVKCMMFIHAFGTVPASGTMVNEIV